MKKKYCEFYIISEFLTEAHQILAYVCRLDEKKPFIFDQTQREKEIFHKDCFPLLGKINEEKFCKELMLPNAINWNWRLSLQCWHL
jgi:hypothetical protein